MIISYIYFSINYKKMRKIKNIYDAIRVIHAILKILLGISVQRTSQDAHYDENYSDYSAEACWVYVDVLDDYCKMHPELLLLSYTKRVLAIREKKMIINDDIHLLIGLLDKFIVYIDEIEEKKITKKQKKLLRKKSKNFIMN
jgi:hypothetical protein